MENTLVCPSCLAEVTAPVARTGGGLECPVCRQLFSEDLTPSIPEPDNATPSATSAGESVRDRALTASARRVEPAAPSAPTLAPGDVPPTGSNTPAYDFLSPSDKPDELGRLGGYRVLRELGRGGMGVVFLAEDPRLQRLVALKVVRPGLAADGSVQERFLREARMAAAIEHEHIVAVYEVDEDRGVPFLAMQFLQGESLEERLQRVGKLPVAEVVRMGRETAEGLAAAHDRGLIHRDIKPANIFLVADAHRSDEARPGSFPSQATATGGRVKILDFGLARARDQQSHLSSPGAIIGTPAYMSPEQVHGGKLDQRCDIFSLGCVLYRAATGSMPFRGADNVATLVAVISCQPTDPRELEPTLPPALAALIVQLLAKDPAARPSSAHAVALALAAIHDDRPPLPRSLSEPRTMVAGAPPRRLALAAAVAVLGVLALAAAAAIRLATGHGVLVIEAPDPAVRLTIRQHGKTVIARTGSGELDLKVGTYDVDVAEPVPYLHAVPRRVTISRGHREVVRVVANEKLAGGQQSPSSSKAGPR
jgi:hypothetical protein